MDDSLLNKYLEYANTDEAFAVLFVKKHLSQAKGLWIDIVNCHRYELSDDVLHFKFVTGALYKKILHPKYPPKDDYTINGKFDERRYYLMARAITWETAHKDIEQQKSQRKESQKFKITGVSYDRNLSNKDFFREDAPPEIKALANNLNDRTNPLWDQAMEYAIGPEFVYEIRSIQIR